MRVNLINGVDAEMEKDEIFDATPRGPREVLFFGERERRRR